MERKPWISWRLAVGLALWGVAHGPGLAVAGSLVEFIGRSDQLGAAITHYGYVTHVEGLGDDQLFFDPLVRTEATARFTYVASTQLNSRHVVGNIITTATQPGTLTFFERASGGATFGDPASFGVGTPVMVLAIRYHNVLTVVGPNGGGQPTGLAAATADAEGAGLRLRITATGQGTLLVDDPVAPRSVFLLGGSITAAP